MNTNALARLAMIQRQIELLYTDLGKDGHEGMTAGVAVVDELQDALTEAVNTLDEDGVWNSLIEE